MSQVVSSTLKWLSRSEVLTASRCTMVVGPDPRRFPPIPPRAGAGFRQYRLRFTLGNEAAHTPDVSALPAESFYAYCINALQDTPQPNVIHSSNSSKWIDLVEPNNLSADDQPLREVLLSLMDAFPKYDLRSREGVQAAIRDMKWRIASLPSSTGGSPERQGEIPSWARRSQTSVISSSDDRSPSRDALSILI